MSEFREALRRAVNSPTVETDQEGVRFGRIMIDWHDGTQTVTELVPADFSRKLEAERDALRVRCVELVDALRELLPFANAEQTGTVDEVQAAQDKARAMIWGKLP